MFITTRSPDDLQQIQRMSLDKGEESALAMADHTIHYDLPQEQRIVDRTFYIVNEGEPVSVLAKKILRNEDLPNARVFMDRSWLTTLSMFCTYAGNTLLLKNGNHQPQRAGPEAPQPVPLPSRIGP